MTDDRLELSRRKILAGAGAIGLAGAGAGLGTSAYFSDQETFANNQLTAGELDLKVSWEEHYSDWKGDEQDVDGVRMVEDTDDLQNDEVGLPSYDDPMLAVPGSDTDGDGTSQVDEFMEATLQEQFPDKQTRKQLGKLPPDADPCEVLADVPEDLDKGGEARPLIDLRDVKPGDFGEVTFDFTICDNPGYVWLNGRLVEASEGGTTEPEAEDEQEKEGVVELLDELRVTVWYDSGNNILEETETYVTQRSVTDNGNPLSSAVALRGDRRVVTQGSLREVIEYLSTGHGIPLDGIPNDDPRDCFAPTPTIHYLGVSWELPVDHANEIQSDSVSFDLGFYTEQCRHNDGVGPSTGLVAYYPLGTVGDGVADDISGNGNDGTVVGDVSSLGGKAGNAASFDGVDNYVQLPASAVPNWWDGASLSVALWFKTTDQGILLGNTQGPIDPSSGWVPAIYVDTAGRVRTSLFWHGQTSTTASGSGYDDGNWHHLAATLEDDGDATTSDAVETLYVDGSQVDQRAGLQQVDYNSGNYSYYLGTGKWQNWPGNDGALGPYAGALDDARIYDRVLSVQEVQSLANQ